MAQSDKHQSGEGAVHKHSNLAASMSLLDTVLNNALDPGYRAYKKAKERSHETPEKAQERVFRSFLVMVLAAALAWVATVSVLHLRDSQGAATQVKQSLIDQVRSNAQQYDQLQEEVSDLEASLHEKRGLPGGDRSLGNATLLATALTPVKGEGIVVTLDSHETADDYHSDVQDSDLRALVNALWAAGAEAISIDGLRIGPDTSIRTAGSAILVDLTAIGSPYEVEAVGDANRMIEMVGTGAAGEPFRQAKTAAGFSMNVKRDADLSLVASNAQTARGKENG